MLKLAGKKQIGNRKRKIIINKITEKKLKLALKEAKSSRHKLKLAPKW